MLILTILLTITQPNCTGSAARFVDEVKSLRLHQQDIDALLKITHQRSGINRSSLPLNFLCSSMHDALQAVAGDDDLRRRLKAENMSPRRWIALSFAMAYASGMDDGTISYTKNVSPEWLKLFRKNKNQLVTAMYPRRND